MIKRYKTPILFVIYTAAVFLMAKMIFMVCDGICETQTATPIDLSLDQYQDGHIPTLWGVLKYRVAQQPFNLIALIIFVCAILHTFFAHYFTSLSESIRARNIRLQKTPVDSFAVEILHFLGEIEVVFGIWVIPLAALMSYYYGWSSTMSYLESRSYVEPIFVVVIMALSATKPIVSLAEDCLQFIAKLGGGSAKAWWWAILTIGPLSGSLITEPGAMTISALLLAKQFYELKPSTKFSYATLGLLFTNISVGGVFTNFAAPPVLMVSHVWGWDTSFMLNNFGWKALVGILLANIVYFFLFRKEFDELEIKKKELSSTTAVEKESTPFWISLTHIAFLAWTVVHSHHPIIFVGSFLLFLGFHQATRHYQSKVDLKPAVLVGFFLAGLVIHGSLQTWWIAPVLSKTTDEILLVMSAFLTSFNDNAEITFLATLIPSFTETMKYAVLAGAVTGGGLTVIANAPNPSGQAILGKYFHQGISAVNLLMGALFPATVMGLTFYLLRNF